MSSYSVNALSGHSAVASVVNLAVAAWFLVVAGVILSESRATGVQPSAGATASVLADSCKTAEALHQSHAAAL